jgi:hypothetical protein
MDFSLRDLDLCEAVDDDDFFGSEVIYRCAPLVAESHDDALGLGALGEDASRCAVVPPAPMLLEPTHAVCGTSDVDTLIAAMEEALAEQGAVVERCGPAKVCALSA